MFYLLGFCNKKNKFVSLQCPTHPHTISTKKNATLYAYNRKTTRIEIYTFTDIRYMKPLLIKRSQEFICTPDMYKEMITMEVLSGRELH